MIRTAIVALALVLASTKGAPAQYYYGWGYPQDWRAMQRDEAYRWIIDQAREFCRIYQDHYACRRPPRRYR